MRKRTKKTRVPRLRFPEFRDDPVWTEYSLAELSTRIIEKVGELSLMSVSITAGQGFVSQTEKFGRDISGQQYKNYIVLNEGEFAYNKGNSKKYPQGCICKLKEYKQVAAPNAFICFRLKNGHVPNFYQGYFEANFHGAQLKRYITSSARSDGLLNINADDFFSIKFLSPKQKEQQKIATCLSSIDNLITIQTQKIDALKAHKKGLMQQLFPAKGKTVPISRFPEFLGAGEWKIEAFDKLMEIIDGDRGENYPKPDELSDSGYCVFLNAKNVTKSGFKFDVIQFITKEKDETLRKGKLTRADIILTTRGSVGHFAIYSLEVPYHDIRINSGMVILRVKTDVITSGYLYAFSKTEMISRTINNIAFGNVQQQLNVSEIKKFQFYFPTLPEQQKIVACLSSLDNLITVQIQKLDALKTYKKGLMQQLFPTVDEVNK